MSPLPLRSTLAYAPFLLPLLLAPLLLVWGWQQVAPQFVETHKDAFLGVSILYIVIVRLALLDVMLFMFSQSDYPLHVTLIRIVGLFLEITVITILFFALLFYLFGVFELFHYNAAIGNERLADIRSYPFVAAFYISTVSFTTLGLGDWIPQSIHAMLAVSVEVILGVVQAAVFMAIIIYAHQNKDRLAAASDSTPEPPDFTP